MKRALTLILAAAMLLTLAACGGASAQTEPDPAEDPVLLMPLSAAAAEPAEESGEEAPEEPAPTPAPECRLTGVSLRYADEMWAQYDYAFSYDEGGYLPSAFQRTMLGDDGVYTATITYDDAGRMTAMDDSDGSHSEYAYDEDGHTIHSLYTHTAEDGTVSTDMETELVYEDGVLVKEVWSTTFYINDQPVPGTCTVVYTYDEAGNLIRSDMDYAYEDGTSSTAVYEYEYDENGKRTGETYTSTDTEGNEHSFETAYALEYDDHGNIVREERTQTDPYGGSFTTVYETEYTYDDAGNILTEKTVITSDDNGYTSFAYHLPLLLVQGWGDTVNISLLDNAGHPIIDANNNGLYTVDDAELTYDDNGCLTRIDDGAGNYMEFTYEPAA